MEYAIIKLTLPDFNKLVRFKLLNVMMVLQRIETPEPEGLKEAEAYKEKKQQIRKLYKELENIKKQYS